MLDLLFDLPVWLLCSQSRMSESGEKRLTRNITTDQDKAKKQFSAEQKKDYLKSKEQVKKVSRKMFHTELTRF